MNLQDQLTQNLRDVQLIKVEMSLLLGAILLLFVGLVSKKSILHKGVFLGILLMSFYFSMNKLGIGDILSASLFVTDLSQRFIQLFIIVLALVLIFPRDEKHSTEFYFFMLLMGAGASFMMKANNFLILYLSIELVSFISYILTNFSFKRTGYEASIKYLLFGAISSAIMLFGLGLIYGTTGSFYFSEWDFSTFDHLLSQVGLILFISGIFFKISIMPFHIWVPATYQSAPVDVVAILSIIPKLAGLVLLKRILIDAHLIRSHWIFNLILLLGIITILAGTLGALRQSNTRRMISFGAIVHSGFLLPFAIIFSDTGKDAFWWYSVVYAIMNLGAFYLIDQYESKTIETNDSYSMTNREVWMGCIFTFILISLVGLPPFAGFIAKFFLFLTLWEMYQWTDMGIYLIYLLIAVLSTIASLFFYLRIPYHLFLSNKKNTLESIPIKFSISTKIVSTIFAILLLVLFFVPRLVTIIPYFFNYVHE